MSLREEAQPQPQPPQVANDAETEEEEKKSLAKLNRNLQSNEILTLHYLGLPYVVLSRYPLLRLKLPLSTANYQDDGSWGIAFQLIITCPPSYPRKLPHVELCEKRNVSAELERSLFNEIRITLEQHLGLYAIVAVVSQLQMLLNNHQRQMPDHPPH